MTSFRFLRSFAYAASISALAMGAGAAGAATMTFDGLEDLDPVETYTEDGIFVSGNDFLNVYPDFMDQNIYMLDGGAGAPSLLTFRMADMSRFDLVSMVLASFERKFDSCTVVDGDIDYDTCAAAAVDDVLVRGYRDADLVAESRFDSVADAGTLGFGAAFSDLSRIVVLLDLPGDAYDIEWPFPYDGYPDGDYARCYDYAPCTRVTLDDVTFASVAAIPLPASAPLAASGLAALALLARRRRSARTGD